MYNFSSLSHKFLPKNIKLTYFNNQKTAKATVEVAKSITKIAETVSHCRFEATSPESDDIVVMKVLRVLYSCISSPVGYLLPDDTIWKMIQTCFRFGIHPRLSGSFFYFYFLFFKFNFFSL